MANQFNIDQTNYDIGTPFLSVRAGRATIAHTEKGIVVSLESGTRYTCSYQRLFSMLKANIYDPKNVEVRDNINDILGEFKRQCDKQLLESQRIIKQYEEMYNEKK